MKNLLFLMVFVVLVGCENSESEFQEVSPFLNTTAGVGETVVVRGVTVTVVSIEEGRCPSDMSCFWGGWVAVVFKAGGLNFSLKRGESMEFSSAGSSFRLTLIDVTPYPTTQNYFAKKNAMFFVELL